MDGVTVSPMTVSPYGSVTVSPYDSVKVSPYHSVTVSQCPPHVSLLVSGSSSVLLCVRQRTELGVWRRLNGRVVGGAEGPGLPRLRLSSQTEYQALYHQFTWQTCYAEVSLTAGPVNNLIVGSIAI